MGDPESVVSHHPLCCLLVSQLQPQVGAQGHVLGAGRPQTVCVCAKAAGATNSSAVLQWSGRCGEGDVEMEAFLEVGGPACDRGIGT